MTIEVQMGDSCLASKLVKLVKYLNILNIMIIFKEILNNTFLLYFFVILITQEGCSLIDTCHVFIINYYTHYIINLILLL